MRTRTIISTAAFLAVVAICILAAIASSVVRSEGADGPPYGWQAQGGFTLAAP